MKKRIASISERINEQRLNETIKPFDPEVQKELEKMFAPLIKRFGIELKEIRPDSLSDDGTPSLSVIEYQLIKGSSWVSGTFFNKKDADAAAKIFNETEVTCACASKPSYGAEVARETFGKTLFFGDLKQLANTGGVKLDFDEILKYAKENYTSVK